MVEEKQSILVSIVVVTYNSADFILETLESIYKQTYQNLELIISDDCSKDDTVQLCRGWLNEKDKRFVRCELLTYDQNTGVSANDNRACRAAKGEWIKLLAGDDILVADCIEKYVAAAAQNQCNFILGRHLSFVNQRTNITGDAYPDVRYIKYFNKLEAIGQFYDLSIANRLSAPTVFINHSCLIRLGYYDECFPLIEDWPMWLKATINGEKLFIIDNVTVLYRLNNSSVEILKERDLKREIVVVKIYQAYIKDNIGWILKWHLNVRKKVVACKKSKIPLKGLCTLLLQLLSPYSYYYFLKRYIGI